MKTVTYYEPTDKSSPGQFRLCILHNRLSGPMSSSVLSEVFSCLVPLRSERSESVSEVIVQYAQPEMDWRAFVGQLILFMKGKVL